MNQFLDIHWIKKILYCSVQSEEHPLWDLKPKDEKDMTIWKGWVKGSPGHMYEQGTWSIEMAFPPDYPTKPPVLRFTTPFWHPNVFDDGRNRGVVCMEMINKHWSMGKLISDLMGELIVSTCMYDQNCKILIKALFVNSV